MTVTLASHAWRPPTRSCAPSRSSALGYRGADARPRHRRALSHPGFDGGLERRAVVRFRPAERRRSVDATTEEAPAGVVGARRAAGVGVRPADRAGGPLIWACTASAAPETRGVTAGLGLRAHEADVTCGGRGDKPGARRSPGAHAGLRRLPRILIDHRARDRAVPTGAAGSRRCAARLGHRTADDGPTASSAARLG